MEIEIGNVPWTVELVDSPIIHEGKKVRAVCDGDERRIQIDSSLPPATRYHEFFHEFGHAIQFELDIHDAELLGREPLARLVALGFSNLKPFTLARIHIYLTQGIECDDLMMIGEKAVPIIRMDDLPN